MKKTAYSAIALMSVALAACSSNKKPISERTPMQPTVSSTIYRPAPVPPAWCVAMRAFKAASDEALSQGNLDQVMLSMAALQPYDESPGVLQVVTDVFALYESNSEIPTTLQADYATLKNDEARSLSACP